jgi:hypothetical protein
MQLAEELAINWRSRLQTDCPSLNSSIRESIVQWLLGENPERLNELEAIQRDIVEQAMDYRYRILLQRYLYTGPDRAYRNLIQRLGSLFLIRNSIRTGIALSRDRHRSVVDVLQEVIHLLLQKDRYMQQQMEWIRQCTQDNRMRNALLLTSLEEYCLRPIRNKPLLIYRFVNYLRQSQRGGMTHIPTGDFIKLVSEEVAPDESEGRVSLLDDEAISQYQDEQAWRDLRELQAEVQTKLEDYLVQRNIDENAVPWLKLYLQGHSQEAIAKTLNLQIKQVYRLREKISYHAKEVFATRSQPELVSEWLRH